MTLTALQLSPEELKKYNPLPAMRKRREEERPARNKRRRRAMRIARQAADLLRKEFGAKKVILFGSLAKRGAFTLFSDIDLAVEGMPKENYYKAADAVYYLRPDIKIDLVELETCPPAMRENIKKDGKLI
ncbi:MAG: nucleotidyltransferase domain-containing protein [Chloroflexi bacterium]|nr:nucleotidyltransferase domain-containing protein [Chloroflexota bacterium]